MRIRWRGLELPSRVVRDEAVSSDSYGRFVVEPFEQGFGATIGNSLRRVLLSSLEGAAVTSVKIDGVAHEFTSIDGVLEDVTDIVLNVKGIVLTTDVDDPKPITVERNTAGEIRASDIVTDPAVTIVNGDHLIATLTSDVPFRMTMTIGKGRGYATGTENRIPDQEIGVIPVDSVFSPVLRVRFRTENMRVGQRTNYDRLILEVWTNATVWPEDALVEAGLILRKHTNPFVMYHEMGDQLVVPSVPQPVVASSEPASDELLDRPIALLNLSVRASNCLDASKIATLRDLVGLAQEDLLRFRSFGKTSLHEVQRKLAEVGLALGGASEAGVDDTEAAVVSEPTEASAAPAAPAEPSATDPPVIAETGPMEAFTMGEQGP